MPPQKEQVLASTPLFEGFAAEELQTISNALVEKHFAAGGLMFREGEAGAGMLVLASGTARIFKTTKAGREITIALEPAPASIGELPMLDDGPYPVSASAATEVTAYFLSQPAFRDVCRQNPDIAMRVLASIGRRLRSLLQTLESLTFGTVTQRLARLLLDGRHQAGSDEFALETQEEIASRLGTVREVVARNLARFRAEGLIRTNGASIVVIDAARLEREAEPES